MVEGQNSSACEKRQSCEAAEDAKAKIKSIATVNLNLAKLFCVLIRGKRE